MNKFTELFLDESDTEITPSNSSQHNDYQENMPLNVSQLFEPNRNKRTYGGDRKDLLKAILQNTVDIKQSLKDITTRIEKLEEDNKKMHSRQLTELTMTQQFLTPRKEMPILKTPFNSAEDFEKFEDNVKKSFELSEKLGNEIFNHTESNPSKFVRLIWRKIMVDNVASGYSWKGTPKKKAVDVMAVTNAFRGAFNRKFVGSNKEFNRASAKWFQTSKERVAKKQTQN